MNPSIDRYVQKSIEIPPFPPPKCPLISEMHIWKQLKRVFTSNSRRPIRVAFDLMRMQSGGANGGIKVHLYEFLREFCSSHKTKITPLILCQPSIAGEFDFLSTNPAAEVHLISREGHSCQVLSTSSRQSPTEWNSTTFELLEQIDANLLYCGFGFSDFYNPNIPQISLLVDCLHKDHPDSLPPEEVKYRESWYRETIERSTLIQTNSKFCVERLQHHYGIPSDKLFYIYLPLQHRFDRIEAAPLLIQLRPKEYFFYPANFWKHKNHERLIEAYARYSKETSNPWDLVLTGQESDRQTGLSTLANSLSASEEIHFLGYQSLATLKSLYQNAGSLIFPSLYEGFGLPLLEAAYFGVPIIASNTASTPEVANPKLSRFFNPCDTLEIEASLKLAQAGGTSPERGNALINCSLEEEVAKLAQRIASMANS